MSNKGTKYNKKTWKYFYFSWDFLRAVQHETLHFSREDITLNNRDWGMSEGVTLTGGNNQIMTW